MDKLFETHVDEADRSFVLTRIRGEHERNVADIGELRVRIGCSRTYEPESVYVRFETGHTEISAEEFTDLNIRVTRAFVWLMQARGDVRVMHKLLSTI